MRIRLKNFGILKQAEFELGDITIICGENNTGKTYAAYALFGFLSTWRRNIDLIKSARISEKAIKNLLNDGVIRIDLIEHIQNIDSILKEMCSIYTRKLSRIFAASKDRFRDSRFQINLDTLPEAVRSMSFKTKAGSRNHPFFSISTVGKSAQLEISLLGEKQEVNIADSHVKRLINHTVNEIIFEKFFPDTYIASTERTGAAIFRKELDFARNRLLKEMSRADEDVDPRDLLFRSYQDYALPVECNVDFTRKLEKHVKHTSFLEEKHPELLGKFADIIGGAYNVDRSGELRFLPKGKRPRLTMGESSSSVRSMLDIGFYLRHAAEVGDLLIIDEPELNLHPENQRRIARLFASLANLGIKIFITTHSDYIVKELNTLIMLNHDEPHLKRIAKAEGYDSSELIDPKKIKVYVAKEDLVQIEGNKRKSRCHTLVEADINPQLGIEVQSFDRTINKMNEIQESIIWRDEE